MILSFWDNFSILYCGLLKDAVFSLEANSGTLGICIWLEQYIYISHDENVVPLPVLALFFLACNGHFIVLVRKIFFMKNLD